jgi:hypothetical protein
MIFLQISASRLDRSLPTPRALFPVLSCTRANRIPFLFNHLRTLHKNTRVSLTRLPQYLKFYLNLSLSAPAPHYFLTSLHHHLLLLNSYLSGASNV